MNARASSPVRAARGEDSPDVVAGRLRTACEQALDLCRSAGADQAQVNVRSSDGLRVGVRLGEVETLIRRRDRDLSVVAYFGGRRGEASTGDLAAASLRTTVEKACAIARRTGSDPCNGLVDPQRHPQDVPDLDLWHPWALTPQQAIAIARDAEAAGRAADPRIGNSNGAEFESGAGVSVLANSNGFFGTHCRTRHGLSASFIAGDAGGMQRGGWFDSSCVPDDLQDAGGIGRRAAERAVRRLGARRPKTMRCPVLLVPEVAAGLVHSFLSAIRGTALYRRASFLDGTAGRPLFPAFVDIDERPRMPRGPASRSYDADGVAALDAPLVRAGVLQRYLLDEYAARRLGLSTTGNAGGTGNVVVAPGGDGFAALLKRMQRGLVVCGVMGQGVSLVTGGYSRGAWGFWVENGEIAHPVEEVTIASNLREMFAGIVAVGSDVDRRTGNITGSLLIEQMTMAGA